jgi:y4mF family transcriptional regulator
MIIHSAKDLGLLVRSERKKRGWSQRELAERVGVSPLWISNFERGKSTAHIGLVLRTLRALDVKLRVGADQQTSPGPTTTADLNSLFSTLHTSPQPLAKPPHE